MLETYFLPLREYAGSCLSMFCVDRRELGRFGGGGQEAITPSCRVLRWAKGAILRRQRGQLSREGKGHGRRAIVLRSLNRNQTRSVQQHASQSCHSRSDRGKPILPCVLSSAAQAFTKLDHPPHEPQRRAVRLACPFFGWQSAGRGRRDALPYSQSRAIPRVTGEKTILPCVPIRRGPPKVRALKACRGLRAWRARKEAHETEEAGRVPAALTARAKQERRRNDKKRRPTLRESDWLVVLRGRAQARKREKGPPDQRSPHRQPEP